MTTQEQTCEERIGAQLEGRLDDFTRILKAIDKSEGLDGYDDAQDLRYEYPLHVETKKVVVILLSTGGPHDEFRVTLDDNGDPEQIEYRFLDWFDGATRTLEGPEFERAAEFLEPFYTQG